VPPDAIYERIHLLSGSSAKSDQTAPRKRLPPDLEELAEGQIGSVRDLYEPGGF
jgi:hypothetical protein